MSDAVIFKTKDEASAYAANTDYQVVPLADVYAVIVGNRRIKPMNYFTWKEEDKVSG